jgi:TonB family protein
LATAAWWGWNYVWSEPVDASESTSNHDSSRPVVDVSSAEMEQRLIHRAIPVYPASALQAKVEGVVVLDTIIGTDGAVQHVQVLSGPDALSSAAMDAVKWWRFQPYQRNGRPVRTHTILEVDFRLNP